MFNNSIIRNVLSNNKVKKENRVRRDGDLFVKI